MNQEGSGRVTRGTEGLPGHTTSCVFTKMKAIRPEMSLSGWEFHGLLFEKNGVRDTRWLRLAVASPGGPGMVTDTAQGFFISCSFSPLLNLSPTLAHRSLSPMSGLFGSIWAIKRHV